jgi:hypothetical protein
VTGAYKTKQVSVIAVRYDGSNAQDVADVAQVITAADGRLWVLGMSGPCEVRPGWWVSQASNGEVCVHSAEAWTRYWEAAEA